MTEQWSPQPTHGAMRSFAVGLCLAEEPLRECAAPTPSPINCSPSVNTGTSYAVPSHTFIAHVRWEASVSSLSAAFDVPEEHIVSEWLGPMTTTKSCETSRQSISRKRRHKGAAFRFTPRSVLDAHMLTASSPSSSATSITSVQLQPRPSSTSSHIAHANTVCKTLHLDATRFASLFIPRDANSAATVRFANDLTRRLRVAAKEINLFESTPSRGLAAEVGIGGLHRRHVSIEVDDDTFGNSTRGSRKFACGLHRGRSHRHIEITCDGGAAHKVRGGLYRTALSIGVAADPPDLTVAFPSSSGQLSRTTYFEVAIIDDDGGKSGVCIGIATAQLGADRLVGSDDHSVGLHSSGYIVRSRGRFEPCGISLKSGDRIGCAASTDCSGDVIVNFFVNGKPQTRVSLHAFSANQAHCPHDQQLYAAISLYKTSCKVAFLCCRRDWMIDKAHLSQHFGFVDSVCAQAVDDNPNSYFL